MFNRSLNKSTMGSFSKRRDSKKTSFRENGVSKNRPERSNSTSTRRPPADEMNLDNNLTSSIITLVVGREQRLFAAHEDVLSHSAYFKELCRSQILNSASKRINLPDEEPTIFSSILEYLYKGDYHPRLVHNKRRNAWELETSEGAEGSTSARGSESTVYVRGVDGELLKDTVIYCAAERYGLEELKKLALRKQGLQSGIQCSTILTSARYAYANTPDSDSKLRAHYLALIIRSRGTFKRSGTMQMEMAAGGSQLFFDLFVALCNHVDDVASVA